MGSPGAGGMQLSEVMGWGQGRLPGRSGLPEERWEWARRSRGGATLCSLHPSPVSLQDFQEPQPFWDSGRSSLCPQNTSLASIPGAIPGGPGLHI